MYRSAMTSIFLLCAAGVPAQSEAKPKETVIYNFSGGSNGATPFAGLTKGGDLFYGTTSTGGSGGRGTVFSVSADGIVTTLYAFTGTSDAQDVETPLLYADGALYGVSREGGSSGEGLVFKITLDGQETVLHVFQGPDGDAPLGGLVELNGVFYGTTLGGGSHNAGTIFSLTKSGIETVLHSFDGDDGQGAATALTVMDEALYGTASQGGPSVDCGTAFSITPDGTFTLLHSFSGIPGDGCEPEGVLLPLDGTLYGTTMEGGEGSTHPGMGVLFSLTPSGDEAVLGGFGVGGHYVVGNLVAKGRFLYGTAQEGGGHGDGRDGAGTVFRAALAGGHRAHKYYGFGRGTADGMTPCPGLVRVGNSFYGTTTYGGAEKRGSIFKITQ